MVAPVVAPAANARRKLQHKAHACGHFLKIEPLAYPKLQAAPGPGSNSHNHCAAVLIGPVFS